MTLKGNVIVIGSRYYKTYYEVGEVTKDIDCNTKKNITRAKKHTVTCGYRESNSFGTGAKLVGGHVGNRKGLLFGLVDAGAGGGSPFVATGWDADSARKLLQALPHVAHTLIPEGTGVVLPLIAGSGTLSPPCKKRHHTNHTVRTAFTQWGPNILAFITWRTLSKRARPEVWRVADTGLNLFPPLNDCKAKLHWVADDRYISICMM